MSYYAVIDDQQDTGGDVASNQGWSDFVRWAATLDAVAFAEVVHVAAWGWSQHLDELNSQLVESLKQCDDESAKSVGDGIVEMLERAGQDGETIVVTDGAGVAE